MTENNFHAGRVFEPLPGDKTRVKTYADGGALISDKVMPTSGAMKLVGQPILSGDVHINHNKQPNHSDSSEATWWSSGEKE